MVPTTVLKSKTFWYDEAPHFSDKSPAHFVEHKESETLSAEFIEFEQKHCVVLTAAYRYSMILILFFYYYFKVNCILKNSKYLNLLWNWQFLAHNGQLIKSVLAIAFDWVIALKEKVEGEL